MPQIRFEDKHDRLITALESGRLVELRVVRTPLRVEIHAVIKHPDRPPVADPVNPVGLDKGLKSRLVTSDGEHLPPTTVDLRQVLRAQRRFSRSVKGSAVSHQEGQTHLAKQHRRLREQAIQADFRLADRLVKAYDGIAVEKLNVAGLLRTKWFSKQMSQQRWGAFDLILEHKAAKAGVRYAGVNPQPHFHRLFSVRASPEDAPIGTNLPVRTVWTMRLCRDHNAAINVCARGLSHLGSLGSGGT